MTADAVAKRLLNHRIALTGFVRAIVHDAHAADDIFQEICVKAVARADRFETKQDLMKWTRTVAKNQALDLLRKRKRGQQLLSDEAIELLAAEDEVAPEESNTERLRTLQDCVQALTPKTREVLTLRYNNGLAGQEVANRLNRKTATVYKTLARAYQTLRDCMNRAAKPDAAS